MILLIGVAVLVPFLAFLIHVLMDNEPDHWDTPHNPVDASIDSEASTGPQTFTIGGK